MCIFVSHKTNIFTKFFLYIKFHKYDSGKNPHPLLIKFKNTLFEYPTLFITLIHLNFYLFYHL